MSPETLRDIRLPPDAPKRFRVGQYVLRFLAHHNRIDGFISAVAIWWGFWTLYKPGFWGDWPVTALLAQRTGGHPELVSWTLIVAGLGSYVSRHYFSRALRNDTSTSVWYVIRTTCALAAVSTWSMLAYIFATVDPMFSPGFACYSAFAGAKFMSYLNFVIHNDQRDFFQETRHGDAG